jgi:hypothetical protein
MCLPLIFIKKTVSFKGRCGISGFSGECELVPFVKKPFASFKLLIDIKQPRNRPGKVFYPEAKNDLCVGCNSL